MSAQKGDFLDVRITSEISSAENDTCGVDRIIEGLLQWCATEFKIENYNYNFIKNFLASCNYNERKCRKKLSDYFFYKKIHPEYFLARSLTDTKFRSFCSEVFSLYIPILTKDGHRIFIDKVTDNADLFDIGMIMQYFSMQTDLRYLEDGFDNGDIILFDCNHVNLLSFVAFLPYFIKSLTLILKVYPLNLKQLILINTGKVMASVLNFFKYFVPSRYKHMVHFHADGTRNFLLYVEAEVLPSDYEGTLPTLEELRNNIIARLDSKREWFENMSMTISKTAFVLSHEEEMTYGPRGSFKQLFID